ncbi:hypothetical protein, partial [Pseudomonas sp. GW460-12-10-14-TSB1]
VEVIAWVKTGLAIAPPNTPTSKTPHLSKFHLLAGLFIPRMQQLSRRITTPSCAYILDTKNTHQGKDGNEYSDKCEFKYNSHQAKQV